MGTVKKIASVHLECTQKINIMNELTEIDIDLINCGDAARSTPENRAVSIEWQHQRTCDALPLAYEIN